MGWTEYHERYRIIDEVILAAGSDPTGHLPWREEYAEYFGDREGLVTALRLRWERICQAQLDADRTVEETHQHFHKLEHDHAAILRILKNHVKTKQVRGASVG